MTASACSVAGCPRPVEAKALCATCYARAYQQKYRKSPRFLATRKAWREANRERIAAYTREYDRDRPYRERDREATRSHARTWSRNNPDAKKAIDHARRARIRGAEGRWTQADWQRLKERYANTCPHCGAVCGLTVDHVVPISWGGNNFASNLTPLCKTCNSAKKNRWLSEFEPWDGIAPRPIVLIYLGDAPDIRE